MNVTDPRGALIDRALQLGTVATALGVAWAAQAKGTPIGAALAEWLPMTPAALDAFHLAVTGGLIALAAALAIRPAAGAVFALAGWLGLTAVVITARGEAFAAPIMIVAHAARIALPLAWLAWRRAEAPEARRRVLALMQVAIAATFIGHGVEALMGHPKFVDYIVVVGRKWHLWQTDAAGALDAMWVIGVVDIAVGLSIIARPTRPVAMHMAFWGAVTALSRVLYADLGASYEVLIRAAHFTLPLAIAAMASAVAPVAPAAAQTPRSRPVTA